MSYMLIKKEEVAKAMKNENGLRFTPSGVPVFNSGEHHVVDLSRNTDGTIVILLPDGNAVTVALIHGEHTICDIAVVSGYEVAKTKMLGIDKNQSLDNCNLYSLVVESDIKLHDFEATDNTGHSMECAECGRFITIENSDDWDMSFREKCTVK